MNFPGVPGMITFPYDTFIAHFISVDLKTSEYDSSVITYLKSVWNIW